MGALDSGFLPNIVGAPFPLAGRAGDGWGNALVSSRSPVVGISVHRSSPQLERLTPAQNCPGHARVLRRDGHDGLPVVATPLAQRDRPAAQRIGPVRRGIEQRPGPSTSRLRTRPEGGRHAVAAVLAWCTTSRRSRTGRVEAGSAAGPPRFLDVFAARRCNCGSSETKAPT
jgi:hypothetical protein